MAFFATAIEPLGAPTLFNFGPLPITNTMLYGMVMAVAVLLIFGAAAKASQLWPKSKLAYWVESLTELIFDLVTDSFGNRKTALRHFPLLLTLFIFILACYAANYVFGDLFLTGSGLPVYDAGNNLPGDVYINARKR
jgi:F0F1-type ATP synthase membrane subunit a